MAERWTTMYAERSSTGQCQAGTGECPGRCVGLCPIVRGTLTEASGPCAWMICFRAVRSALMCHASTAAQQLSPRRSATSEDPATARIFRGGADRSARLTQRSSAAGYSRPMHGIPAVRGTRAAAFPAMLQGPGTSWCIITIHLVPPDTMLRQGVLSTESLSSSHPASSARAHSATLTFGSPYLPGQCGDICQARTHVGRPGSDICSWLDHAAHMFLDEHR